MKLLVATKNKKKLNELSEILSELVELKHIELISLASFPKIDEVEEIGITFEENAIQKAVGYAKQTGLLTLAEDSGLSVDVLRGAPGVYSARFAGPGKNDLENCIKVLELMRNVPPKSRNAQFECSIAIASPDALAGTTQGIVRGRILTEMRGENGFGYDPLFFYPPFGKTLAEVDFSKKNSISHRRIALEKAQLILAQYLPLL